MVNIPQLQNLEVAMIIYYNKIELNSKDIRALFGSISSNRISALKKLAKDEMIRNNSPMWDARSVRTEDAFAAWGLNIQTIERNYKKLKNLGICYA